MGADETRPVRHDRVETAVDAVFDAVGKDIVLGLPLGLGKPGRFANALYRRAADDPSISLTIFTALTLEIPQPESDLERRLVEPIYERLYGGYESLDYATARRAGSLPDNVRVHEFYFQPGALKGVRTAQTDYVSTNYTFAPRDILGRGLNVIGQMAAVEGAERSKVSLSCNPDITLDLADAIQAGRRGERAPIVAVGQVHSKLPYMSGPAEVPAGFFDHLIENPDLETTLFGTPRRPISTADWATALHIAGLIEDGGTLQIGIGALGDAIAAALILRHEKPQLYAQTLDALVEGEVRAETTPFETGLFGCSEMFVEGFLQLYKSGVLKREVRDAPDGPGAVFQGGFFLGPPDFYEALNALTPEERAKFPMMAISWVNQLSGEEELKRAQRTKARFVNSGMMATLLGAVVSDQLEDGSVISGVGGQYNFVAQAHALPDARSILAVRAVRQTARGPVSNIVFDYGHTTIPRHLRDVVATEYGIADLRGKSDGECVAAMLNIADSRFQDELLAQAKRAGKIAPDHEIPAAFRENLPKKLDAALSKARAADALPRFPFGTELTGTELALAGALQKLQKLAARPVSNAGRLAAMLAQAPDRDQADALARLGLGRPGSLKERAYARLVASALRR